MTKKVDTWMPLMVDKYLGDTTHLSTEQHGAYLLLLMAMWKRDGSLPNSDAQLAAISRLQPARWKAHREVLLEFFTIDGNTITQKRLSEELTRAKKVTDAKAKGGAAGAKKRWHGDGIANGIANDETDSTAIAEPMANGSQNDAPARVFLPIPLDSPSEKKTPLPLVEGRRRQKNGQAAEGFEEFYAQYPRHVARANAEKVWAKLHPDEALRGRIMSALEGNGFDYRENGRFIPHPATWLNAARWDDEPVLELGAEDWTRGAR